MEELHASLKELQLALQALLKKHNSLKKENELLKLRYEELQQLLFEKEKLLQLSEEKLTTNSISSLYNGQEKKMLELKINGYLKDIEKCLSLLNA